MFEWMPVLSGAVLGLLQLRGRIAQRTLLCLGILFACIATASSGEVFVAPQLILVDLSLVAGGVFVVRTMASSPLMRRDRHPLPRSIASARMARRLGTDHAAHSAHANSTTPASPPRRDVSSTTSTP